MQVKKQQLELDTEKWTGSKLGKEYAKAIYCHTAYLSYMQSTSCKMLGWMMHKLKSKFLGKYINNLRYAADITLKAESKEELKSLLMRVKEESEWAGLKLNIKKNKKQKLGSWHLAPSLHGKLKGEKVEVVTDFFFLGSKITVDGDCSHEIKRHLLLCSATREATTTRGLYNHN